MARPKKEKGKRKGKSKVLRVYGREDDQFFQRAKITALELRQVTLDLPKAQQVDVEIFGFPGEEEFSAWVENSKEMREAMSAKASQHTWSPFICLDNVFLGGCDTLLEFADRLKDQIPPPVPPEVREAEERAKRAAAAKGQIKRLINNFQLGKSLDKELKREELEAWLEHGRPEAWAPAPPPTEPAEEEVATSPPAEGTPALAIMEEEMNTLLAAESVTFKDLVDQFWMPLFKSIDPIAKDWFVALREFSRDGEHPKIKVPEKKKKPKPEPIPKVEEKKPLPPIMEEEETPEAAKAGEEAGEGQTFLTGTNEDEEEGAMETTQKKKRFSLEDFDEDAEKIRFTPRSKEAILACGIRPKQLLRSSVINQNFPSEILQKKREEERLQNIARARAHRAQMIGTDDQLAQYGNKAMQAVKDKEQALRQKKIKEYQKQMKLMEARVSDALYMQTKVANKHMRLTNAETLRFEALRIEDKHKRNEDKAKLTYEAKKKFEREAEEALNRQQERESIEQKKIRRVQKDKEIQSRMKQLELIAKEQKNHELLDKLEQLRQQQIDTKDAEEREKDKRRKAYEMEAQEMRAQKQRVRQAEVEATNNRLNRLQRSQDYRNTKLLERLEYQNDRLEKKKRMEAESIRKFKEAELVMRERMMEEMARMEHEIEMLKGYDMTQCAQTKKKLTSSKMSKSASVPNFSRPGSMFQSRTLPSTHKRSPKNKRQSPNKFAWKEQSKEEPQPKEENGNVQKGSGKEPVGKGSGKNAATKGSPKNASTKGKGSPKNASTKGSPKNASTKGSPKNASTKGSPKNASTKGSPKNASTKGSPKNASSPKNGKQKEIKEKDSGKGGGKKGKQASASEPKDNKKGAAKKGQQASTPEPKGGGEGTRKGKKANDPEPKEPKEPKGNGKGTKKANGKGKGTQKGQEASASEPKAKDDGKPAAKKGKGSQKKSSPKNKNEESAPQAGKLKADPRKKSRK